jgi:hypothetical protein
VLRYLDLTLCFVRLSINPVQNLTPILEMLVDVVEAFIPSLHPIFLEADILAAEATPEAYLVIVADVVLLNLGFKNRAVYDTVLVLQVSLHAILLVEDFAAPRVRGTAGEAEGSFLTFVQLGLEVLRVLVSLPVILRRLALSMAAL